MARDYSAKEAKLLICEHNSLLKTLDGVANISLALQQEVYHEEDSLANYWEHIILNEVKSHVKNGTPHSNVERFITALYRYQQSLSIASLAKHCQDKYQSQIQLYLLQLHPRTKRFPLCFLQQSNIF